jgi:hypothetical protein
MEQGQDAFARELIYWHGEQIFKTNTTSSGESELKHCTNEKNQGESQACFLTYYVPVIASIDTDIRLCLESTETYSNQAQGLGLGI